MNNYLLDANVFIEAYNRYYADSIAPSFWQWLAAADNIHTISQVKDEVGQKEDGCAALISSVKVVPSDLTHAAAISDHVNQHQTYSSASKHEFLSKADFHLVCAAKASNWIVVTQEVKASNSKKVKIPNICEAFSIQSMNTFTMLKTEQICLSETMR